MNKRVILHCDCNSFFASVETALNPEYRGVPMAVCGSVEERHGIVLAKNELAKKYGIQTAETVYSAKRKCPNLVIAKPHHKEYERFSKMVNAIYARYTDIIEPFGIDESWLDVTASERFFGTGPQIAEKIRRQVKDEIGITVSIGVSFNKVFAKLGSDYKKPDAITVISEENFKDIVYPLPARDLLFVGKKTEQQLYSMGARTIGDIVNIGEPLLKKALGKMGEALYKYAAGLDDSPVASEREEAKSVGSGFTFNRDLVNLEDCRVGIEYLSDDIAAKLRKMGMLCSTVSLSIKDDKLNVIQRQRPQIPPADTARLIASTAYDILLKEWDREKPIRMLTVTAQNLIIADTVSEQLSIFETEIEEENQKSKIKEEMVDKIRQKYGAASILQGSIMNSDIGVYRHED
ncbi:MAG: DNA polymerase IV [Clostridia bacterium]|nr:DNA polymerase IV [Clostridia bacterium]